MYRYLDVVTNKCGKLLLFLYIVGALKINKKSVNSHSYYYGKIILFHPISLIVFVLLVIFNLPINIYKTIFSLYDEIKGDGMYLGADQ